MPLEIIRNDITQVHVEAIVNSADPSLLGGGGADGDIHRVAGPELLEECRALGGCEVGQAKITKAYRLPARYVIHTVGPVWRDGKSNEIRRLAECYSNCLALAKEYGLESIAFPLISSGVFGFPKDQALKTAIAVIGDFLLVNEMSVYLVVYDKDSFQLSERLFSSIKQYIDDNYVERSPMLLTRSLVQQVRFPVVEAERPTELRSLESVVLELEETFSQRLMRLIAERGMNETETYRRANIGRKLFSKIRNDIHYRPSKSTVLALAIALKLNLDETTDLLLTAGFALSNSHKFDVIIKYFLEKGNYNIFEINEALFAFDQNLLGV